MANSTSGVLHKLFNEARQEMFVVIHDWTYKVSTSLPKYPPWVLFQWQGITTTVSKRKMSVIGEFIIADDRMQQEWSGHPFEVGVARLISGETDADAFISVDIRTSQKSCEEIWRAFVLGQGGRPCGGIAVKVKFGCPSTDDWKEIQEDERYKNPDTLLAVRAFTVISGGSFKEATEMLPE